jgi:hypothetical protein
MNLPHNTTLHEIQIYIKNYELAAQNHIILHKFNVIKNYYELAAHHHIYLKKKH